MIIIWIASEADATQIQWLISHNFSLVVVTASRKFPLTNLRDIPLTRWRLVMESHGWKHTANEYIYILNKCMRTLQHVSNFVPSLVKVMACTHWCYTINRHNTGYDAKRNIHPQLFGYCYFKYVCIYQISFKVTGEMSWDNVALLSLGHTLLYVRRSYYNFMEWASFQIRIIAGCACAGNAENVFHTTTSKETAS